MIPVLRRLVRDNTSLVLLSLLLAFGALIAWHLTQLAEEEAPAPLAATLPADPVPIPQLIEALQGKPASRPQLAIQRWTTTNGARVLFVPAPEIPLLDVHLLFDAGSARDGDLPGLARLTSALIGEGTEQLDTDAIALGFESIGARFGAASYRDMTIVELRTLADPATTAKAVDLYTRVIAGASFPESALARIRDQMLIGLQRDEERPGTLASRAFMAALYLSHPYAQPPEGTRDTLKRITREQLRSFHARHYVARNAVIAMTGAIDRAQASQLAEQIASALPPGEPASALPAPPEPAAAHFHVDYRSQQTHLLLGLPALARGDPDEAALSVANEILGGDGLASLLAEAVRNQRGLAYSVNSNFQPMRAMGPFSIILQTRNDAAGEALAIVQDVLRGFAEKGPTQAQFDDARRQLVGRYPMQFASNDSIVSTLGMLGFYNLPDDYILKKLEQMESLNPGAVRDAFRRHAPIERLITVTLGPEKPVPLAGSLAPAANTTRPEPAVMP